MVTNGNKLRHLDFLNFFPQIIERSVAVNGSRRKLLDLFDRQYNRYAAFCRENGLRRSEDRLYVAKNVGTEQKIKSNTSGKSIEKQVKTGILKSEMKEGKPDVHTVGKIDREIYKCVTDDITTDEVIITDERIGHIKERHPNDYERYYEYMKQIVEMPDYIVETKKTKTALILKEIVADNNEKFKTVLRLKTYSDNPEFKNSIITFMHINEKEVTVHGLTE